MSKCSNRKNNKRIRLTTRTKEQEILFMSKVLDTFEDESRSFSNDVSHRAIARQNERFLKKFAPGGSSVSENKSMHNAALQSFRERNDYMKEKRVRFSNIDPEILTNAKYFIERHLWRANKNLARKFSLPENAQSTLDTGVILNGFRFGPGASNGHPSGRTHFCDKIDHPLTTTERAAPLVRVLSRFIAYKLRHDDVFAPPLPIKLVTNDATRLTTVAKNDQVRRVIGKEPSGNMALQLALASVVEEALSIAGFDIRCPNGPVMFDSIEAYAREFERFGDYPQSEWNKNLARAGSLAVTDLNFSTIDLSNASDYIQADLIEALWPADVFQFMCAIRAQNYDFRVGDEVVTIPSNIFMTMGNGFTFPVMTMTFLALYYGFYATLHEAVPNGTMRVDPERFAVFGDDIVIPTHYFEGFCQLLEDCGLVINRDKSFSDGYFRESCGGDFYNGKDITPFYIKSLRDDAAVYVAINQLLEWSAKIECAFPRTLSVLLSHLNNCFTVPEHHGDAEGIRVDFCPRRYKYLRAVSGRIPYTGPSEMLVILGGYATPAHSETGQSSQAEMPTRLVFTPRTNEVYYTVESSRILSGYVDGSCALSRTGRVRAFIQVYYAQCIVNRIMRA